jgi:signal transduction histidine kinase
MAVVGAPGTARRVRSADPEPRPLASLSEVAADVVADVLAATASPDRIAHLVARAALETGSEVAAARRDVYALAARDPRLLTVDPSSAMDAHARALVLFAPVIHASVWRLSGAEPERLAQAGSRVARDSLRRVLRGGTRGEASPLRVVPVTRLGGGWGALVVQVAAGSVQQGLDYARAAADALAPVVERHVLLGAVNDSAEQLLRAADRRSARMAYDLHDGPLQDLTLLVGRLAFLPRQLDGPVEEEVREALEQGVGDIKAIAMEIAEDLRELAAMAGGGARLALRETLEQELSHFRRRTRIRAALLVEGAVDRTTPSQRITVARVVEEALANVREHSRASEVRVVVERREGFLRAAVIDDGCGFDVARAQKRAARDNRLGLLGMRERVALLGGQFEVDSRPGGPTIVSALLPAWSPPATGA